MNLELVIKTPDSAFLELIEYNHEELKTALAVNLEKYQGRVYDENGIKEAKADRALLNKLNAAIDDERKRLKARCEAPYKAFETKIRELQGMVTKPMLEIDSQVKKFEDGQRAERKKDWQKFYAEVAAEIIALVPFDRVFEDKWLNSSTSKKAVEDAIKKIVSRIKSDMATIDSFGGEMALNCKDVYLRTLNLSDALNEKTRLEELAARFSAEESRKKAASAMAQAVTEVQAERPAAKIAVLGQQKEQPEALYTLEFRVIGATKDQLIELRAFLESTNIQYERA